MVNGTFFMYKLWETSVTATSTAKLTVWITLKANANLSSVVVLYIQFTL